MSFSAFDHRCMAEALRLAGRGLETCHPNPRVGCVIAKGGKIVGRGWHQETGGAHAEVNALLQAGAAAREGTAYVTLEPCSHHGRTPPCSLALAEAGVRRVVAAVADPNGLVDGRGFEQLRARGIEVEHGLMAHEAEALNLGFFSRLRRGRPWVRIKIAQSLDGRTALFNGQSRWITGPASRADVQRWRARSSAVLTGIGTLLADDPSLNVRDPADAPQPLRVIADSHWRTPAGARTLGLPGQVLIAGRADAAIPPGLAETGAELLKLHQAGPHLDLEALLRELAVREVNEIQVEAGATLCGALLGQGLVDELLIYLAPHIMGDRAMGAFGLGALEDMAQVRRLEWLSSERIGADLRIRLRPHHGED